MRSSIASLEDDGHGNEDEGLLTVVTVLSSCRSADLPSFRAAERGEYMQSMTIIDLILRLDIKECW